MSEWVSGAGVGGCGARGNARQHSPTASHKVRRCCTVTPHTPRCLAILGAVRRGTQTHTQGHPPLPPTQSPLTYLPSPLARLLHPTASSQPLSPTINPVTPTQYHPITQNPLTDISLSGITIFTPLSPRHQCCHLLISNSCIMKPKKKTIIHLLFH